MVMGSPHTGYATYLGDVLAADKHAGQKIAPGDCKQVCREDSGATRDAVEEQLEDAWY